MDNAYQSPDGGNTPGGGTNTINSTYFWTGNAQFNPLGLKNNKSYEFGYFGASGVDTAGTWNALLADQGDQGQYPGLRSVIGSGELVFYFNLNQSNSDASPIGLATGQDLLAWARISVEDNEDPNRNRYFYLSEVLTSPFARPGATEPDTSVLDSGPQPDPSVTTGTDAFSKSDPDWAYVHGEITVDAAGNFLHYGAKVESGLEADPAGSQTIPQNLGRDLAAFAAYNPELDELVKDTTYDVLRVDFKMSGLTNGYEQLFIMSTEIEAPPIPEPASLLVWGVLGGGAAAGMALRRRWHGSVKTGWTEENRKAIFQVIERGRA